MDRWRLDVGADDRLHAACADAVLVFILRSYEDSYTTYSKVLLAVSITCPLSVGVISIPAIGQSNSILGSICMFRLFGSPLVLVGMFFSLVLARFRWSQILIVSAISVEFVTLVIMMVGLMSLGKHGA